jgi:hypothetical protein
LKQFLADLRRDVWVTGSLRWGFRSAVASARYRADLRSHDAHAASLRAAEAVEM